MTAVVLVLFGCAASEPAKPFTVPPFRGVGRSFASFDIDPRPGKTASTRPNHDPADGSEAWAWSLEKDTEVLALAPGRVEHVKTWSRPCPDVPTLMGCVRVLIDPPFEDWSYDYCGIQARVSTGSRVAAGDTLGTPARPVGCPENVGLYVEHRSAGEEWRAVDPFGHASIGELDQIAYDLFDLPASEIDRLMGVPPTH